MRTINRNHLAVIKAASTDETRFILNGVLLEETEKKEGKQNILGLKAVATDGRILAQYVSYNDQTKEMPVIAGMENAKNTGTRAIVPSSAIGAVIKALPKKQRRLPVLQNAVVKISDDVTTFGATDLETTSVIPAKNIEGHFPNYEQVIPTKTPIFVTAFSASYLRDLADLVLAVADDRNPAVRLSFYGHKEPLKADYKTKEGELTAVLMPMKVDNVEKVPAEMAVELADCLELALKIIEGKKVECKDKKMERINRALAEYRDIKTRLAA